MNFSDALARMKDGVRVGAAFLPEHIFITVQKPDAGSMNTEPYLKMVTVASPDEKSESQFAPHIVKCEPWEPGRRSLFSDDWATSKWQGIEL